MAGDESPEEAGDALVLLHAEETQVGVQAARRFERAQQAVEEAEDGELGGLARPLGRRLEHIGGEEVQQVAERVLLDAHLVEAIDERPGLAV